MLYLISQKGLRSFKIGHTTDIRRRMRAYRTCMGSTLEVIATMEGTEEEEANWHLYMEYLKFEKLEQSDEWYKIPRGITKNEIKNEGFDFFLRYQNKI